MITPEGTHVTGDNENTEKMSLLDWYNQHYPINFYVGSVVALKSGGNSMTVSQVGENGMLSVVWMDPHGDLQYAELHQKLVQKSY